METNQTEGLGRVSRVKKLPFPSTKGTVQVVQVQTLILYLVLPTLDVML